MKGVGVLLIYLDAATFNCMCNFWYQFREIACMNFKVRNEICTFSVSEISKKIYLQNQ